MPALPCAHRPVWTTPEPVWTVESISVSAGNGTLVLLPVAGHPTGTTCVSQVIGAVFGGVADGKLQNCVLERRRVRASVWPHLTRENGDGFS